MPNQASTKVLVVVGDSALSTVVTKALTHPQLVVEAAVSEQSIVTALTSRQFDLVLVGGHVGKRGPLVLCDVVRIRQSNATVLVLLGDDTDDVQLRDHMGRQLPGVRYVELRGVAAGPEQGTRVRATVLGAVQVDEDAESAAAWPQLLISGEVMGEVRDAGGFGEAHEGGMGEEAAEGGSADGLPAIGDAVTDDDLVFAARMTGRTRGVDFRSELQPSPTPEGTDRATGKLRDRVRELERHLARMAHVYAGRLREFEGAAERIATAQAQRDSVDKDLQRLREHLSQEREHWREQKAERDGQHDAQARRAELAETRLQEAAEELTRLREELKAKEVGFAGMLKQAQDAFTQLREQSAQALAFYERRVGEQDKQAQLAAEELASLRNAHQDATNSVTQLTQQLQEQAQLAGQLAAATAGYNEQRELAERARAQLSEVEGQLAHTRAELEAAGARAAEALERARAEHEAVLAERAAALARAEQRNVDLEESVEARAATITDREREVATLAARLEARDREVVALTEQVDSRDKELNRLRKSEADLREENEHIAERGLEKALDARLVAIEEHARLAAESASSHGEFLSGLDQRTAKQATLVDRLLRIIEPPETTPGGHVTPVVAARRLAERMRPDETVVGRLLRRLREPPWVFGVAVVAVVTLVAIIIAAMSGGEPLPEVDATPRITVHEREEPAARRPRAAAAEATPAAAASAETAPAAAAAEAGEAEVPEQAVATGADAVPAPLTPDERKVLRKKLFDSFRAKKWDDAAAAGTRLRMSGQIDWEAELKLAHALRNSGRPEEAVEVFRAFLADYPDNKFADETKVVLEELTKR